MLTCLICNSPCCEVNCIALKTVKTTNYSDQTFVILTDCIYTQGTSTNTVQQSTVGLYVKLVRK